MMSDKHFIPLFSRCIKNANVCTSPPTGSSGRFDAWWEQNYLSFFGFSIAPRTQGEQGLPLSQIISLRCSSIRTASYQLLEQVSMPLPRPASCLISNSWFSKYSFQYLILEHLTSYTDSRLPILVQVSRARPSNCWLKERVHLPMCVLTVSHRFTCLAWTNKLWGGENIYNKRQIIISFPNLFKVLLMILWIQDFF